MSIHFELAAPHVGHSFFQVGLELLGMAKGSVSVADFNQGSW